MKIVPSRFLFHAGIFLLVSTFTSWTASAGLIIVAGGGVHKPKVKHAPGWTAPAGAPAAENDASDEKPISINTEAKPSACLQPFLDSHLDKILAPLGSPAFTQADIIAGIKDAYAQSLPKAPDAHKPAYQQALLLCDTVAEAVAERQKAVAALNGAYANRSSEAIQPRGGKKAVKETDKDEAFFYESQKNNWKQNAAILRQRIVAANQRERAAEAAAGEWPEPVAPPAAEPSVAAPAGPDPVIGQWMLHGESQITLGADNGIHGSREGRWVYTCTTDAGRNYELRWANKGWVDYMILSTDGKQMEGKSKKG